MKRWALYLILVPLVLGGLVYLVGLNVSLHLVDMWNRDPQPTNTARDIVKSQKGNTAPHEILRLRSKYQLRPLTEREEGGRIEDLPNGIYGFSTCSVAELHPTRSNTFPLEIQKHDGILFYVGYVSGQDIDHYLARQKNFHILMSPHPREGASSLLDIPVEFVSKCEERSDEDGVLFDLFVKIIPELHI
jgi:hypothetical protein